MSGSSTSWRFGDLKTRSRNRRTPPQRNSFLVSPPTSHQLVAIPLRDSCPIRPQQPVFSEPLRLQVVRSIFVSSSRAPDTASRAGPGKPCLSFSSLSPNFGVVSLSLIFRSFVTKCYSQQAGEPSRYFHARARGTPSRSRPAHKFPSFRRPWWGSGPNLASRFCISSVGDVGGHVATSRNISSQNILSCHRWFLPSWLFRRCQQPPLLSHKVHSPSLARGTRGTP